SRHDFRRRWSPGTIPLARADGTDQNVTRRPNWICRAGAAELITPNVDDPKTVPGFPKFVWLMTLKTSARNSAWTFWVTVKLRISDMSTWITPGPRTIPTPAFPNAYAGGCDKAAVLN